MSPLLANLVFAAGICALFYLDRDPLAKTSKALWVPVVWLFLSGSRPVSVWLADLGLGGTPPQIDSPEQYLDGSPTDRLAFIILLIVGAAVLILGRRNIGVALRSNILVVLFFAYCLLSVLWSDFTFVAFKRWIKAVGDPTMVLIILSDPGGLKALKRVLSLTAFLVIAVTFLNLQRKPAMVHLMVLLMVCLPLFSLFSGSGGGIVESLGRDPTITGRTAIWKAVLSVSGNSLVGTGFESFWMGERLQRVC